jgi:hypothetical protein
MSFKENLLKKIKIDNLFNKVYLSIGPLESGRKVDKEAMQNLLAMGSFETLKERDLTLFVLTPDAEDQKILVLDNDLPIYQTTVDDVLLRKSPTIKEMISIKNAIKILSDADVVVSKKEISAQTIRKLVLAEQELCFSPSDIRLLAEEGETAFKIQDASGLETGLKLFFSLLGYTPAPKALQLLDYEVTGRHQSEAGKFVFGPMVIRGLADGSLKLIDEAVSGSDKEKIKAALDVMRGNRPAALEGAEVFGYLADAVKKQNIWDAAQL